jgi:CoA-dependent NAD(P)H sulfur oxidoreductase
MRIVVIGGVAAGMSAASRAKRENPAAEVVVYERGQTVSYGACGLPYVLSGMVEKNGDTGFGALVARTPEQLRGQGIGVRLGHEVTGIDAAARTVTVQDHATGRVLHEPYDELLIATGVRAARPDFMPDGLAGLHVLRDIPDGEAIQATLAGGARRAIIIGGGYIGLELAEALHARGLSVAVLEAGPAVAGRMLDTGGQPPPAAGARGTGSERR